MLLTTSSQSLCSQLEIHHRWCRKNETWEHASYKMIRVLLGHNCGEALQLHHGHCQHRGKRLSESKVTYSGLLWSTPCSTCHLQYWLSVPNENIGGCKTAERGWGVMTVLSTKSSVQGVNQLGVRWAKLDDVPCWHMNKGSPICWGWKSASF